MAQKRTIDERVVAAIATAAVSLELAKSADKKGAAVVTEHYYRESMAHSLLAIAEMMHDTWTMEEEW